MQETKAEKTATRVLVLSAAVGEGHRAAARALVTELALADPLIEAVHCDGLEALGRLPRRMISDIYRGQLRWMPWVYGLQYALFARIAPARALGRALLYLLGARGLLRLVRAHEPDVVVSTQAAINAVLGRLRLRGLLEVPVCAAILDHEDFAFWAHRGIDHHLVMYEQSIASVERVAGEGSALRSRPLIDPDFFAPRARSEARRTLELPVEGPVVVVSGGGWGVGDLRGAIRGALRASEATIVCLTGRNDQVRDELAGTFSGEPRVRVLGFTERMSDLLAASDALVLSSGGVTCLEALVRRCPIVTYGAPPGHARANARALAELGLAQVAGSPLELEEALRVALDQPPTLRPRLSGAPPASSLVLAARPRTPAPGRRRASGGLATVAAAAVLLAWAVTSHEYPHYVDGPVVEWREHSTAMPSRALPDLRHVLGTRWASSR